MRKFKVGDKVRIRKDSIYAHQSNTVGMVTEKISDGSFTCHVEFEDGSENGYRDRDLELVETKVTNWKARFTK